MSEDTRLAKLERREASLEAELKRRNPSSTADQIAAARGRAREPNEPEYKDPSTWSTTERQIFAHYGRKPLRDEDD